MIHLQPAQTPTRITLARALNSTICSLLKFPPSARRKSHLLRNFQHCSAQTSLCDTINQLPPRVARRSAAKLAGTLARAANTLPTRSASGFHAAVYDMKLKRLGRLTSSDAKHPLPPLVFTQTPPPTTAATPHIPMYSTLHQWNQSMPAARV